MTRILIIEDNADICYTLEEICGFEGWQTETAENGHEGILKFKKKTFDLIIVDYHMPVFDGLKTIKSIRNDNKNIPILVLTVDERQELANELLDAGANDFALKPIKAPDLIARIKINLKAASLQLDNDTKYVNKGISKNTQALIVGYLEKQKKVVTIDDIVQETNLAYQTVHRYLTNLVEEGLVETDFDYGKVGRPKNVYWLNREKN